MKKEPGAMYTAVDKRQEVPRMGVDAFRSLAPKDQLTYLAGLSHLAPSTHNTQPWRFFIDAKRAEIRVFLERTAVLPASDPSGRQAVISVGCALENMTQAAELFGMHPTIMTPKISSQKTSPLKTLRAGAYTHLSTVRFNVKGKTSIRLRRTLFDALWERKVVRAEYDSSRLVPSAIVRALIKMTDGKRVKLHIVTDAKVRFNLAELQAQADAFVFNDPFFMKELGQWLLPNDTRSPIGIPGIQFGLRDDESLRIHLGLTGKATLEPEDSLKFAIAARRSFESSSAICLLTIEKDIPNYWLEAGRAGERMLLHLTSQGMQTAVHAGIVEVSLINSMFAATFGRERHLAMVFRTGWVKDQHNLSRPASQRLPLDDVLLKDIPRARG